MPQALSILTAPSPVQPAGIIVIYVAEGGAPQGKAAAPPGSDYRNLDGGTGATLWVKTIGTGASGWVAVA